MELDQGTGESTVSGMSRFSHELALCLDRLGMKQVDLERTTGIQKSILSKYKRGSLAITPAKLQQLCKKLPKSEGTRLVIAFLQDQLPVWAVDWIRIEPVDPTSKIKELEDATPLRLASPVRAAVEGLARCSTESAQVADLLLQLHTCLRPNQSKYSIPRRRKTN